MSQAHRATIAKFFSYIVYIISFHLQLRANPWRQAFLQADGLSLAQEGEHVAEALDGADFHFGEFAPQRAFAVWIVASFHYIIAILQPHSHLYTLSSPTLIFTLFATSTLFSFLPHSVSSHFIFYRSVFILLCSRILLRTHKMLNVFKLDCIVCLLTKRLHVSNELFKIFKQR